ncbi:MAG: S8 family serine peptidase [Thermoplasmatota archaeon]
MLIDASSFDPAWVLAERCHCIVLQPRGTSRAAPSVAGTAALVWQENACLAPDEVKWVLMATSRSVGGISSGCDAAYGWSFLDAEAAVRAASHPAFLGQPPFSDKAAAVPHDNPASPWPSWSSVRRRHSTAFLPQHGAPWCSSRSRARC